MRRRRWLRRSLIAVPMLLLLIVAGFLIIRQIRINRNERELRDLVAETERIDPGWRWNDLCKAREIVHDEHNACSRISEVKRSMAGYEPPRFFLIEQTHENAPNRQLSPTNRAEVEESLGDYSAAIKLARGLYDMPRSRHAARMESDPELALSNVPSMFDASAVVSFLQLDTERRLFEDDRDGALQNVVAMLNCAQADAPFMIGYLIRSAACRRAIQGFERVLALSRPGPALENLPAVLEQAAQSLTVTESLRDERAFSYAIMEKYESGEKKILDAFAAKDFPVKLTDANEKKPSSLEAVLYRPNVPRDHALNLRQHNSVIEISKLPMHEQTAALAKLLPIPDKNVYWLADGTDFTPILNAARRNRAWLGCARAAVAIERFRLASGHWPASLAEISVDLLPKVPLDPFDGEPLRYRKTDFGIVVYSIGENGTDDGGLVGPKSMLVGAKSMPYGMPDDIGMRLWNSELRRLPP